MAFSYLYLCFTNNIEAHDLEVSAKARKSICSTETAKSNRVEHSKQGQKPEVPERPWPQAPMLKQQYTARIVKLTLDVKGSMLSLPRWSAFLPYSHARRAGASEVPRLRA